jgi:hypothetical protein
MTEKDHYPKEENLANDCVFWRSTTNAHTDVESTGCVYPKAEMMGRISCEGIIDDVCLYLLRGRKPKSLTSEQITNLKTRVPSLTNKQYIPPGDIEA